VYVVSVSILRSLIVDCNQVGIVASVDREAFNNGAIDEITLDKPLVMVNRDLRTAAHGLLCRRRGLVWLMVRSRSGPSRSRHRRRLFMRLLFVRPDSSFMNNRCWRPISTRDTRLFHPIICSLSHFLSVVVRYSTASDWCWFPSGDPSLSTSSPVKVRRLVVATARHIVSETSLQHSRGTIFLKLIVRSSLVAAGSITTGATNSDSLVVSSAIASGF
jgi:hypothetical protein